MAGTEPYIALHPLDIGGIRAFNSGDEVPVGHVERFGWGKDDVARAGSKAADAATADSPG